MSSSEVLAHLFFEYNLNFFFPQGSVFGQWSQLQQRQQGKGAQLLLSNPSSIVQNRMVQTLF